MTLQLEALLNQLIGRDMGVPPNEVTTERVHAWREERIYPTMRFEYRNTHGGYVKAGLRLPGVLNRREMQEGDEFLARFATPAR